MKTGSYGFGTELENISVEEAISRVTAALSEVGFGVLTQIDVDKTLQEKLGESFRRYSILGACHPQLALKALKSEAQIGLLMPCNVLVQESEAGVRVSAIDPDKLKYLVESLEANAVMAEAGQLLRDAIGSLQS